MASLGLFTLLIHSFSIYEYLTTNNVQLGASYRIGQASTERYNAGFAAAAKYVNAQEDEIGRATPKHFASFLSNYHETKLQHNFTGVVPDQLYKQALT